MSPGAPSLTLRALLKTAVSSLGLPAEAAVVTGLSPSAMALVTAASAAATPTIVIVPTDAEVDTLAGDARFFYAALHGLSDSRRREERCFPFRLPRSIRIERSRRTSMCRPRAPEH